MQLQGHTPAKAAALVAARWELRVRRRCCRSLTCSVMTYWICQVSGEQQTLRVSFQCWRCVTAFKWVSDHSSNGYMAFALSRMRHDF